MALTLTEKIKAAAKVNLKDTLHKNISVDSSSEKKLFLSKTTNKVVAIGASTGGTQAIQSILKLMPVNAPGIIVVQHMPERFTKSFSNRLDTICDIKVKEAEDSDRVIPGTALIAPGNKHMLLKKSGSTYYVEIKNGPLVKRQRPAVEVLFNSVAKYAGNNAIGVILTGMGSDGSSGLLKMKESGAQTLAQDEKSSVVFGMPREAIKLGAANKIVSLDNMPREILNLV
jgi:two-component system chemotaxis response regulator CheB